MSQFDFLAKLSSNCTDELLNALPYRERELVKLLSGLGDGFSYSVDNVAFIFRTSPERVESLAASICRKFHFFEFIKERQVQLPNKRVLYIEKDKSLTEIVAYNLDRVGYKPIIAFTGSQGFQLAASEHPDVIVLEPELPDMDGLDLIRLLLGSHKTQHIPIIILTAKAEESDQLIGLSLGAQDYIVKPFSIKVFFARLKLVLHQRPRNSEIVSNPNTVMTVSPVFSNRHFAHATNQAFALMPFTAAWSNRVWQRLQQICKKEKFGCKRADDIYGHNILEDIWTAINEASVIIADVTGRNPNVMYEIGIAHTLGKTVILLTQEVHDIPFDFRGYRHIEYADNVDGFAKLERELPNFLRAYHRSDSPLLSDIDHDALNRNSEIAKVSKRPRVSKKKG